MAEERCLATTTPELHRVLSAIQVGPFMDFCWQWEVSDASVGELEGWGLAVSFVGVDRNTRLLERMRSRTEFIARGAEESEIVKTAWLLFELAVRHELMENWRYRGARVFDPHHTMDVLARAARRPLAPLANYA